MMCYLCLLELCTCTEGISGNYNYTHYVTIATIILSQKVI